MVFPLIVANWKLHKNKQEAAHFLSELLPHVGHGQEHLYLAPSFTSLDVAAQISIPHGIKIGAQNVSEHLEGAFTGEVSVAMLKEIGVSFSLVGHSERRAHYHETNKAIRQKIQQLTTHGLTAILCVGETHLHRTSNMTQKILSEQLQEGLKGLDPEFIDQIIIAYEPVWAIGTGHTATADMAQETHFMCREILKELFGENLCKKIPILYGGSVNENNVKELLSQPDINGVLVGGASLHVSSFLKIIKHSREIHK